MTSRTNRRRYVAEPVLNGLKEFQRATVDHVIDRFYGPKPARRFLVADETGLGKSIVARGVIARTIEQLQDDDSVERIDVVYVCSNAEIAQQNLRRLDVTDAPQQSFTSRLTLLAKHSHVLSNDSGKFLKPVNLVSFTPGTSFDFGWQTGMAEERAMLYLLLRDILDLAGYRATAARVLLQATVTSLDRFTEVVERLESALPGEIDRNIMAGFHRSIRGDLLGEFECLLDQIGRRRSVPKELRDDVGRVVASLRRELARASVHTLEPDLVILDEFQRFRQLLDDKNEAGMLAHHLYDYGDARVLLLSATPYKPFTYAEESTSGEDHYSDFLGTLRFLSDGSPQVRLEDIAKALSVYRKAAISGRPTADVVDELRTRLLDVMCRSERPELSDSPMLGERVSTAVPTAQDLLGYVQMRKLAATVEGQVTIDYWKSAPYFVNFMEGYQLAEKVRDAHDDPDEYPDLLPAIRRTQRLDRNALRRFEFADFGNARLRELAAQTVDVGWWKLLWMPPSLPYLAPDGPYAEPFAASVTKRLVFSSWTATPTAVASLLSYEAERRLAEDSRLTENSPEARRRIANRLVYSLDGRRPQGMSTLALFWPMPGLAALADPLTHAQQHPDAPIEAADLETEVVGLLRPELPTGDTSRASSSDAWYWAAALRRSDSLPADLSGRVSDIVQGLSGTTDDDEADHDPAGLTAHVELVLDAREGSLELPSPPPDLAEVLAKIGLHSPGNVAWRALARLIGSGSAATPAGHWQAAAILASGLRTLFARPETTLLLDKLLPNSVYWRAVLRYCAWGNLQAVLNEYLHHLASAEGIGELDDQRLAQLATTAADAISLRPSNYRAFDPLRPDRPIVLNARFALRYGNRRQKEEDHRQPEVRGAFNSPFWPFVLATTSVGQEGIDFHWWSHAVLHWNTPANPVDFEQREGRVNRFGGHAVRRNIAHRHRRAILSSGGPDPWRVAYEVASDETERLGEFAPHWVYPGPAVIERHLTQYPLSSDATKLQRIKDDVALYRLTIGQPRQEDFLELLQRRGTQQDPQRVDDLRLDLRPPERSR